MSWPKVFTGTIVDVSLKQAKLGAFGIESLIPEADLRGLDPQITGEGFDMFDLCVSPENEAQAREVLARPDRELLEGEAAS